MKENTKHKYIPRTRLPDCLIGRDLLTAKDRLSVAKWGWITLRIGRAKRWWRRKGMHAVRNRYRTAYALVSFVTGFRSKNQ